MRIALSLFLIGIAGCAGKAPPNAGAMPDAADIPTDAPGTSFLLSGKVMDYFGNVAIQVATIAS